MMIRGLEWEYFQEFIDGLIGLMLVSAARICHITWNNYPSSSSYCFLKQSPTGKKSQHLC